MTQWIQTSRLHQDGTPVAQKIKLESYDQPVWFTENGYAEVSDAVADILASTLGDISKVSPPADPGNYYGDESQHETIQVSVPDGVFNNLVAESIDVDQWTADEVDTQSLRTEEVENTTDHATTAVSHTRYVGPDDPADDPEFNVQDGDEWIEIVED